MTSTISTWYNNQYAAWNRTRRMHAPTLLARTDSHAARAARAGATNTPANGDTVINMGDVIGPGNGERPQAAEKKKQDTLFGPSIGVVNPGPDWTEETSSIKSKVQDTLTPELVKSWIDKSKDASQPTTTLQALVNLKRPSLRLSPITHDEAEDADPSHSTQHGLEFQFDCDAPKCRITLCVVPSVSGKESSSSSSSKPVVLFNMVVDGGFGRTLKLEEGAMLELDKYDSAAHSSNDIASQVPLSPSDATAAASPTTDTTREQTETAHPKKRFALRIRKRTHPHAVEDTTRLSVAGPALQVVDMEVPTENTQKEKDEGGVKIFIKLEALDINEHSLASQNSQTTYLHIVRLGSQPEAGSADTRPWVVRVVKREATIGPHTFHLHEIYGLSSHTSNTQPPPNEVHSYPPTAAADNDDPTSECLVCLSSPREVVLLPCRHLVACKECAINMIEFGAGGQLVHAEDSTETAPTNVAATGGPAGEGSGANGDENAGTNAGAGTTTTTTTTATQPRPRRKRKAKGWFCPVCRQPYTSLLRISTGSAACALKKGKDLDHDDRASSPDTIDSHSHPHPPLNIETVGAPMLLPLVTEPENVPATERATDSPPPSEHHGSSTEVPHVENDVNESSHTNDRSDDRQASESVQEETFHDAEDHPVSEVAMSTPEAAE